METECRLDESGSEEGVVSASCKLSRPIKYREFLDWLIKNWLLKDSIAKVKVKPTLEQATKAQSGSRGITLLFL
jgi:hypothetical protein